MCRVLESLVECNNIILYGENKMGEIIVKINRVYDLACILAISDEIDSEYNIIIDTLFVFNKNQKEKNKYTRHELYENINKNICLNTY